MTEVDNGLDFSYQKLPDADFRRRSLRGANFRHAYLPKADFTGADLTHADFTGADLRDSDFTAAITAGIILNRADLEGCTLEQTGTDDQPKRLFLVKLERREEDDVEVWALSPAAAEAEAMEEYDEDCWEVIGVIDVEFEKQRRQQFIRAEQERREGAATKEKFDKAIKFLNGLESFFPSKKEA